VENILLLRRSLQRMSSHVFVGRYFMDDESNSKKANESINEEDMKEEALKKLVAEAGNGKSKLDALEEPIFLTLNLKFILDRVKIRNYDESKIVLYIIDCFLKGSENLLPIAAKVKKEAMGNPRLIIPSRKLVN